jgi:hypothetical protein
MPGYSQARCTLARRLMTGDAQCAVQHRPGSPTLRPMNIPLSISRDIVFKLRKMAGQKFFKILIDGSLNLNVVCERSHCTNQMPGQHSPDKEPLSLQIPRALMGRLRIKARMLGMKLPGFVVAVLTEKTHDITLSSRDCQLIADATKQAEKTGKRCATPFDDPKGSQGKVAAPSR